MLLVLLWLLYLGYIMYFTDYTKPWVTSVNCSLPDCPFRLPCETKDYFEVASRIIYANKCVLNMQPFQCTCTEKRVALMSTIA